MKKVKFESEIKIYLVFIIVVVTGYQNNIYAQSNEIEHPDKKLAENHNISNYDSLYGGDFLFNNGRIYTPENPRAKGNPFFMGKDYRKGSLTLKNKTYYNVGLLFDIHRERLICLSQPVGNAKYSIIVPSSFINKFSIEKHQFVNIKKSHSDLSSGFYEVIYDGESILCLAKWKKKFLNQYTTEYLGQYYIAERRFYIKKKGKYHHIKNTKDFLNLFDENKKQIKACISKEKINWKKSPDSKLILLFEFCETL